MKVSQTFKGFVPPPELDFPIRTGKSSEATFAMLPLEGRCRVAIENITPVIDGGRYPIKRTVGERVVVEADLFADSHVLLSAVVKYRSDDHLEWEESPMIRVANDRWQGEFTVNQVGISFYSIEAWVDPFKSWREDLRKRIEAGQEISVHLLAGAKLIEDTGDRVGGPMGERLRRWANEMVSNGDAKSGGATGELALDETLGNQVIRHAERSFVSSSGGSLKVVVEPTLARFSAWYEMFPRSFSPEPGRPGTFKDCEMQLERVAKMGFDVLYFPPIHPIGQSFRKGKNNNPECQPDEPGSPWAIGGAEGGH